MARDDYGSGRSGGYTSGGAGAYGAVPVAPPLPHTAPQSTKEAIATGTQVYSQLPGFKSTLAGVAGNISSDVAGQVPDDVIALLKQQGAESNAVTGAASNAAYLRALGTTSLGLKEQGQKDLESILPHLPGYNVANNPAFYISPEQQYERDLQSNIFAAAPNPTLAAGAALGAAQSGYKTGAGGVSSWASPTNAWSGNRDALGFPNVTTADLPGQTPAGGMVNPAGGYSTMIYGGTNIPEAAPAGDPYANWASQTFGANNVYAGASDGGGEDYYG